MYSEDAIAPDAVFGNHIMQTQEHSAQNGPKPLMLLWCGNRCRSVATKALGRQRVVLEAAPPVPSPIRLRGGPMGEG